MGQPFWRYDIYMYVYDRQHKLYIISSKRSLHRLSFQLRQRSQQVVMHQDKGRAQIFSLLELEFFFIGILKHPPTLVIAKNLEKKYKISIVLKWFLGNFEQFLKKLFFHPKNVKTVRKIYCYSSMVGSTWCNPHIVTRPTQWAVWHGGLGRPESAGVVCWPPTLYWKKSVIF